MPHKSAKLLQDVLDAGEAIRSFVSSRSLGDFQANLILRSAVERQFEIMGEAMKRLGQVNPALTDRLDSSSRIIAFRNIIAHGYDVLDPAIVWSVIQSDLPKLLDQVEALLSEAEKDL